MIRLVTLADLFPIQAFSDQEPYKDIWHGCLEMISVCDLIQTFPSVRRCSLMEKDDN